MTSSAKIGRMNDFCEFEQQVPIEDEYGSTEGMEYISVAKVRCIHALKSKTAQARIEGGAFDFYQVHEFTIRDSPRYTVRKDMQLIHNGEKYIIRGVAPHKSNPNYITITTEKR